MFNVQHLESRPFLAQEPRVSGSDRCNGESSTSNQTLNKLKDEGDNQTNTYCPPLSYVTAGWNFPSPIALCNCHEVHESYRELGIHRGYRKIGISWTECVSTLAPWAVNNETVNVWTHILGTVFFLWRFICLSQEFDFSRDTYSWPLYFYMMTTILYPIMSASAHAFSALSIKIKEICYFLDYTAIAVYSFGSAILYRAYIIPDALVSSSFADVFLYVAVFNSVVSTSISCYSRFVADGPWQKFLRLGSFALPFFWDTAPLLYRLVPCWLGHVEDAHLEATGCGSATFYHSGQLVAAFLAGFIYASHLPERIWPGQFDFIGNSHNWLHVFGVIATTLQTKGALLDIETRRSTLVSNGWTLSGFWSGTTPMIVTVISLNSLIVASFSFFVMRQSDDYFSERTKTKRN